MEKDHCHNSYDFCAGKFTIKLEWERHEHASCLAEITIGQHIFISIFESTRNQFMTSISAKNKFKE